MTVARRSLSDLKEEKARISEQICDLLDAEDDESVSLLKTLRERRKQLDQEINNYQHAPSVSVPEAQFNSSFLGEPLPIIPETPNNALSKASNTSFLSRVLDTPGSTQLSSSGNPNAVDPANAIWSKATFPWSRDAKKALTK